MAKPVTHTIVISATTKKPHPLTISSGTSESTTEIDDKNFTTIVNTGDFVIWEIAEGCDISAIDSIQQNFNSGKNFFIEGPSIGKSATKKAKIGNTAFKLQDISESYIINYFVSGVLYSQDPVLKMKT